MVFIFGARGAYSLLAQEVTALSVTCLCYEALSAWHLEEIASCQATMAEAVSLATELNDMHALAVALYWSGWLAHFEDNPAEVERLASDLIELSTRQHFAHFGWLEERFFAAGRAAFPVTTAEGISWIEDGIEDWRAAGSTLIDAVLSRTEG